MQFKSHSLVAVVTLLTLVSCGKKSDGTEISSGATIFGNDDRVILNAQTKIERAVGQLQGRYASATNSEINQCTATVLSGDYLITAAHCVFKSTGEKIRELYFYPEIKGENNYSHGRFPVTEVYYPAKYNSASRAVKDMGNDFAILKVAKNGEDKSLEEKVVPVGFEFLQAVDKGISGDASTMGYPGDKPRSEPYKQDKCSHSEYDKLLFKTDCDIFRGQSGSPFFLTDRKTNKKSLIGVVVAEAKDSNYVSRITNTRLEIIESIINDNFFPENHSAERWKKESLEQSESINILIQNKCKNDVIAAYSVMKQDGTWNTDGFYTIRSGQTMQIAQTHNGVYYLKASLKGTRKTVISGNEKIEVPRSGNHFFERFEKEEIGDVLHTISECGT